jgi:hypothetical protein
VKLDFGNLVAMHEVENLLVDLIAQLETSKPNPVLWNSAAARALENQISHLQRQLHTLRSQLVHLPRFLA